MNGLREGEYEIPVIFELPGNVTVENEISAKVTISKADEEEEE